MLIQSRKIIGSKFVKGFEDVLYRVEGVKINALKMFRMGEIIHPKTSHNSFLIYNITYL